jgi:acetylornithine deacetylase/succinyl-diaminopimelate desuccinylase-like protein
VLSTTELLQELIRFDTTNPPGNEGPCIEFLRAHLEDAGCETPLYEKEPGRPNLVSRLAGGDAPPLLLQGHVDVVTTAGQNWIHPPFEGRLEDGYLWGRGALDMKAGVRELVSAFVRARREGAQLPGDLVLVVLSDEEAGGNLGARFLVEEHPELFAGMRYGLGEFGGFTLEVGGKRFYPIQVAEKQICWLKATIRGSGGHGAMINRGGTVARLGRFLTDLDRKRMPVHVTPVVRGWREWPQSCLGTRQHPALAAEAAPTDQRYAIGSRAGPFGARMPVTPRATTMPAAGSPSCRARSSSSSTVARRRASLSG